MSSHFSSVLSCGLPTRAPQLTCCNGTDLHRKSELYCVSSITSHQCYMCGNGGYSGTRRASNALLHRTFGPCDKLSTRGLPDFTTVQRKEDIDRLSRVVHYDCLCIKSMVLACRMSGSPKNRCYYLSTPTLPGSLASQ